MKELENYSKVSKEIKAVKPIQKQTELIDTLLPQKGHKCFEINRSTGEINEAVFKTEDVVFRMSTVLHGSVQKKLVVKENHVYITALNKQNALKKYQKQKNNY